MMVLWLVVLAGLVWLAWRVWGRGQPGGLPGPWTREDDAVEILKRRYARGEISKEEYEERRRDLE